MSAPQHFVEFLQDKQYHPRSNKHGNKLVELVVDDLMERCKSLREAAIKGRVAYTLNYAIDPKTPDEWNIDLVVGPPATPTTQTSLPSGRQIARALPSEIWLAVDTKSIMTEYGKARRNRYRDFDALHSILHRRNPKTVVGGLMVLNIAPRFKSPLRDDITLHPNISRHVKETLDMFAGLEGKGLDALGMIVLSHTNVKGDKTTLNIEDPTPPPGQPLSYDMFLQEICQEFGARFG